MVHHNHTIHNTLQTGGQILTFKNSDPLRNISIQDDKYYLRKQVDGEIVYSETFKKLRVAMSVRDELEKVDYDIDLL